MSDNENLPPPNLFTPKTLIFSSVGGFIGANIGHYADTLIPNPRNSFTPALAFMGTVWGALAAIESEKATNYIRAWLNH